MTYDRTGMVDLAGRVHDHVDPEYTGRPGCHGCLSRLSPISARAAVEFEEAIAKVQAVLGTPPTELAQMRADFIAWARTTPLDVEGAVAVVTREGRIPRPRR